MILGKTLILKLVDLKNCLISCLARQVQKTRVFHARLHVRPGKNTELKRWFLRKLEGQKNKLRAFSKPNARKNKYVTRQPFNDTQSKNHIVNHSNVNLSDLQKQISDLKNIVFSHVIMNSANKQDKQYNSVFSDSTKAGHKTSEGIS